MNAPVQCWCRTLVLCLLSLVSPAARAAAQTPMDARVTIDYRGEPAEAIISALARAAGIPVQMVGGTLQPVTIALTQVKLSNALNALCDTARCSWTFDGTLHVTPQTADRVRALPRAVSLRFGNSSLEDAFIALGEALDVPVVLDLGVQADARSSATFQNAPTDAVLNALCAGRCTWNFTNGTLTIGAKDQGR